MSKVVRFYEPGLAKVLKTEDESLMPPAEGEARIAVSAIGVNRFEIMFRSADRHAVCQDARLLFGL